jgi:hypothetical protein
MKLKEKEFERKIKKKVLNNFIISKQTFFIRN